MSSFLDNEARGDWGGLKGAEYHLLYALWLLLRGAAAHVAFYQGNDILARPAPPPSAGNPSDEPPLVSMRVQHLNEDVWIQLKSTESQWTRSDFLPAQVAEDNLLKNFICNAVQSQRAGRTWRAQLVTQGFVSRQRLEEFLEDPTQTPDLNSRLNEIVERSRIALEAAGFVGEDVTQERLRELALSVLAQLAETRPKSRETLESGIESALVSRCYNLEWAGQVSHTLLGALLADSAVGPAAARVYDLDWLSGVAGFDLKSGAMFDENPVTACAEAVRRALPQGWNADYFVPRRRLEEAFRQFLITRETVFVLVGPSGSGKTWAAVDLSTRMLDGQARLFIPGSSLHRPVELSALAARHLRPLTAAADWSDEQLLRRLQGAAQVQGQGPLVITVDDLLVPAGNADMFAHDLASLADQCRVFGAKLVLTCQRQAWELYQLWRHIPASEIFTFDVEEVSSPTQAAGLRRTASYSFLLGDLTPDELTAVIHRRLPPERAARAALLLRARSFAALRNPYFLARYLEQHGEHLAEANEAPAPVSVNELLDTRVEQALSSIGPSLGFSADDLRPAFHSLVDGLCHARPGGLSYRQALDAVSPHLGDQGGNFITELRRGGLLTAVGPLNIAEPPVAERFFARRLAEQSSRLSEICERLRPETDAGVAAALMRGVVADPIALAEALLTGDKRWTKAIADGLAQCEPNDYRVLALTAALMRSDPEKIFIEEAGDALGQLASRRRRSWRLAAGMYYSSDPSERYRGEYVLGVAMEFDPVRAAAPIRLKLARAARTPDFFTPDREKRAKLLRGALDPLRLIKHEASARVGRRLIEMYGPLAGRGETDLNYKFLEDIDRARGRIALYGDGGELNTLLDELTAADRLVRYRAACALRGPVIEQPARVQHALCSALRREDEDAATVNRLLLAAYPLVSAAPDYYLNVLGESHLTRWEQPMASTSQVLGHLGDMAARHPADVYRLLPRRLDAYPPQERALMSEILSYAWWRCAEHVSEAATHLAVLAEPDLADVPGDYIPFALRGAAVAQLGLMCLGHEAADELTGAQIFYPHWGLIFTYVNTRRFVRRHAAELLSREGYERLRETLISCVREAEPTNIYVLREALRQSVFRCSVLCLEMLTHFAAAMPDPLPLLTAVPRDWRSLQMARKLLEVGRRDQSLINLAREVCEEVMHGTTTVQAFSEREMCLAELAVIGDDPHAALEEHRAATRDNVFDTDGKARGLARLIDHHPEDTLSLLDESIGEQGDQLILYHWEDLTSSWRALLLARIYARMFDYRPITPSEAGELCEQVLAAVTSLPDSPRRQEYLDVYGAIRSWLRGSVIPSPSLPETPPTLLRQSHAFAVSVLQRAYDSVAQSDDFTWLDDELGNRRGWMETEYTFKDGTLATRGSWSHLNYVYPAARLALVAIGQRCGRSDPAAQLLRERGDVNELVSGYSHLFNPLENDEEDDSQRQAQEDAATAFREQLERTPRDETMWHWYGEALLHLGRFDEAEDALRRCLSLPSCDDGRRAEVMYDIARARARRGREDECRSALEESARLRPIDREHAVADRDLASVRGRDWFQALVEVRRGE